MSVAALKPSIRTNSLWCVDRRCLRFCSETVSWSWWIFCVNLSVGRAFGFFRMSATDHIHVVLFLQPAGKSDVFNPPTSRICYLFPLLFHSPWRWHAEPSHIWNSDRLDQILVHFWSGLCSDGGRRDEGDYNYCVNAELARCIFFFFFFAIKLLLHTSRYFSCLCVSKCLAPRVLWFVGFVIYALKILILFPITSHIMQ